MKTARFTLAKIGLDALTAFVPRKPYEAKAKSIASGEAPIVENNSGEWQAHHVASQDGSYEHHYFKHPSTQPKAPTILLLHGLFLDGRSFFNLAELSSHYELIAYNYPQRWKGYSGHIDDFAKILDDFTNVLGLDSFVLAGVSFGGMVALRYGAHLPASKLRAIVLLSTRVPGLTREQRRQAREASELVDHFPDYRLVWLQEAFHTFYLRRFKGEDRAIMAASLQPKDIAFYRQATRALRDYYGEADATAIGAPVLYLLGSQDQLIPQSSAQELLDVIPHATVEIIPGGSHVMTTLRGEEVSQRIRSFLF